MAPRKYRMGKRAAAVADTRRRIVEAAAEVYRQQGFGASTHAVARRADVSASTVLNHFSSQDELVEAVIAHLIQTLEVPDEGIFDGLETRSARIERLAHELFAFYDRSASWVGAYESTKKEIAAVAQEAARFDELVESLVRHALGRPSPGKRRLAVILAMVDPRVHASLRSRGLSTVAAARAVADLLAAWMEGGKA